MFDISDYFFSGWQQSCPDAIKRTERIVVRTGEHILMISKTAFEITNTVIKQPVHVVTTNPPLFALADSKPLQRVVCS